jgi:hypothetical protein
MLEKKRAVRGTLIDVTTDYPIGEIWLIECGRDRGTYIPRDSICEGLIEINRHEKAD